jgi:hypothetical protein
MLADLVVPIRPVQPARFAAAAPRSIAALMILHGLAHTLAGMRVAEVLVWRFPPTTQGIAAAGIVSTLLWSGAAVGFIAGGFGLLGVRPFDGRVHPLLGAGATASILLLAIWAAPLALVAVAIDVAVLAGLARSSGWLVPRFPRPMRAVVRAAQALILVVAALIVVRPWHMRWGSAPAELRHALPADAGIGAPSYQIQHAITVRAPAERIWPWLVQIGRDRAGFYSYAGLENLFGLHIRNADRIHAEWQELAAGDSVFATPVGWLGLNRRLGWRVAMAEPGRLLVLESWGAFVLEPVTSETTRLIIRTRGYGADRLPHLLLAPAEFLLFEPVHFVMQRRMLVGIRDRAEGRNRY